MATSDDHRTGTAMVPSGDSAGWWCRLDEVVVPHGKLCRWCGRGKRVSAERVALDAVLALHTKHHDAHIGTDVCSHCDDGRWPCQTVSVIAETVQVIKYALGLSAPVGDGS